MHAVIFDIDGTLIQSASTDDALYKSALEAVLGPVRIRPRLHDYDYVSDSGILSQILEDNSLREEPELIETIKARFLDSLKSHVSDFGPFEEVPGAKRFIERLNVSREYSVAVATGGWRRTAEFKLQTSGFDLAGLPIATSDDAIDRTEIMRIALSHLGESFSSITYFGDGAWDRDACEALGWTFVAVGSELNGIDAYDHEVVALQIA